VLVCEFIRFRACQRTLDCKARFLLLLVEGCEEEDVVSSRSRALSGIFIKKSKYLQWRKGEEGMLTCLFLYSLALRCLS